MKNPRRVRMWLWSIGAAAGCAVSIAVWAANYAPAGSFADGYRAWQRGAFASAIPNLQSATTGVLADYALYYLGQAQLEQNDLDGAAASFTRLSAHYSDSVFAARAELALAQIALRRKQPGAARGYAQAALDRSEQPSIQAPARLALAQALAASGQAAAAYQQTQAVRRNYPRSAADAGARALEQSLLREHPELADTASLAYLTAGAQLLLSEGQNDAAYRAAEAAIALEPPSSVRAAMLWVQAQSSRANRERALKSYLAAAPRGPRAPNALFDLARIYWHRKDTAAARSYFRQIVAEFSASSLAPGAMLRIGRTYEDEDRFDQARSAYLAAAAAHPHSAAAADARFRSAWLLYRRRRFYDAAAAFEALKPRAGDPIERAMYVYWNARALEQSGQDDRARTIFTDLAASVTTNYYPEMAARRIGAPPIELPAVELLSAPPPPAADGAVAFHLQRALALRELSLNQLELGELRRLAAIAQESRSMRMFLLAEYPRADGYHDATELAAEMAARGEISKAMAERIRYPRAFWPLFNQAAARTGVNPYLLLAVSRQESLFNPAACSIADARGVMQLLPVTARKVAAQLGMPSYRIDLFDPAINIELGSAKLRELIGLFGGDQFKAIAAYNGGEDAVQRWVERYGGPDDEWVENIEYAETRNYVKKVIGGMREYRMLYPSLNTQTAAR